MKTIITLSLTVAAILMLTLNSFAQKKTQGFKVSHVINAPIDQVWKVIGEDYGSVAYSHPKIISSEYINGSLKSGEGAERVCNFKEDGSQYLHERQVNYDPANYTFVNQVFRAGKFPVVPESTFAIYKLEKIDANSCRFVFDMTYRTSPAMMGGIMKGSFKKLIADYAIAIDHHIATGEKVTKENFKEIKKERS